MLNQMNSAVNPPTVQPVPIDEDVISANDLTTHLADRMDLLRRKRDSLNTAIAELQQRIDSICGGPTPAKCDAGWAGR